MVFKGLQEAHALRAALHNAVYTNKLNDKPRVRIAFPEFGFGSVSSFPGSDSDRFRQARFGFGSVSPGQVRIRIGFCTTKPGSVRFWKWSICILAAIIASGGNASIITKLNAGCNYQPFYDAMPG